jgi:hypothetical protein
MKNCIAANSKIGSRKLCDCRVKNQQPNYVTADSEIDNEELCSCRFRNRQPKTVLLPIKKSAAKNCDPADSEIDSQTLSLPSHFRL